MTRRLERLNRGANPSKVSENVDVFDPEDCPGAVVNQIIFDNPFGPESRIIRYVEINFGSVGFLIPRELGSDPLGCIVQDGGDSCSSGVRIGNDP